MTLLTLYIVVSTIGLIFIGVIWSKSGLANVAIKTAFVVFAIIGVLLSIKALGVPVGL